VGLTEYEDECIAPFAEVLASYSGIVPVFVVCGHRAGLAAQPRHERGPPQLPTRPPRYVGGPSAVPYTERTLRAPLNQRARHSCAKGASSFHESAG